VLAVCRVLVAYLVLFIQLRLLLVFAVLGVALHLLKEHKVGVLLLSSIAVGCALGGNFGSGGLGVCAEVGPTTMVLSSSLHVHVPVQRQALSVGAMNFQMDRCKRSRNCIVDGRVVSIRFY
jgi:hypothetical protein